MAARFLQAVAEGAVPIREEVQAQGKVGDCAPTMGQVGEDRTIVQRDWYDSFLHGLERLEADFVIGVLVYSILFMDWNTEHQPFEGVSLITHSSGPAQLLTHLVATKPVLGCIGFLLPIEAIRTKKQRMSCWS